MALIGTIYKPPRPARPWAISEALPDGEKRFYSLARWALVDAFRACGVAPGDAVLVPSLICREVVASIAVAGARPVFYDVSELLQPETPLRFPRATAVIVVNYFGFPQDLTRFREYCNETGAALIEDNAHGLFSRDECGRLLGSRGDAGVFSLRKTIAVPVGGVLVVPQGGALTTPPLSPVPWKRQTAKQILRRVAGTTGPVCTLAALKTLRRVHRTMRRTTYEHDPFGTETEITAPPNPPTAISEPLTVADEHVEVTRRRSLYALVSRVLDSLGTRPVYTALPLYAVPYGYPLFAAPESFEALTRALGGCGLSLIRWPDLPTAVRPAAAHHYRNLAVVPFLW